MAYAGLALTQGRSPSAGAPAPEASIALASIVAPGRGRPWRYAFAGQQVADPDLARRSVLFLTPREVAQRFGFPTETGAGKGSMLVVYHQTDESGAVKLNVYLSFADGIVMFHETEVH